MVTEEFCPYVTGDLGEHHCSKLEEQKLYCRGFESNKKMETALTSLDGRDLAVKRNISVMDTGWLTLFDLSHLCL